MRHFKYSDQEYGASPNLPLLYREGISDAATNIARLVVKTCADGEGPRDQEYTQAELDAGMQRLSDMQRALSGSAFVGELILGATGGRAEAKLRYEQYEGGRIAGLMLKDYTTRTHTEQTVIWQRDDSGVYVPHDSDNVPLLNGPELGHNELVARLATLYSRTVDPNPEESIPLEVRGIHSTVRE